MVARIAMPNSPQLASFECSELTCIQRQDWATSDFQRNQNFLGAIKYQGLSSLYRVIQSFTTIQSDRLKWIPS
jgi:hypothetical protein